MGLLLVLLALVVVLPLVLNPLLRSELERRMNQHMSQHHVSLGHAHLELLGGAIVLHNLTIFQNAHPSRPINHLVKTRIGIRWIPLLHGRIVLTCSIRAPTVYMSAPQLKTEEATSNLALVGKVLREAPSFRIDRLDVRDFNFAYTDPVRRIEIEHLNFSARDIRRTTLQFAGLRTASIKVRPITSISKLVIHHEKSTTTGFPEPALSVARSYVTIGAVIYHDTTSDKGYRLKAESLSMEILDVSNQASTDPARFGLNGGFMDSGHIYVSGQIHPFQALTDLNFVFELSNLQLRSLNALFRCYGHTEVATGRLSMTSKVFVHDHRISGFVRPTITDLKVQAASDKKNTSIMHKVFEPVLHGTRELVSASSPSISPRVDLSGSIDESRSGLFDLLARFGSKAFVEGFEPAFNH